MGEGAGWQHSLLGQADLFQYLYRPIDIGPEASIRAQQFKVILAQGLARKANILENGQVGEDIRDLEGTADTEVCAPITGMLQAVAGLVIGAECIARETECRARGAERCRFEAVTRSAT